MSDGLWPELPLGLATALDPLVAGCDLCGRPRDCSPSRSSRQTRTNRTFRDIL